MARTWKETPRAKDIKSHDSPGRGIARQHWIEEYENLKGMLRRRTASSMASFRALERV